MIFSSTQETSIVQRAGLGYDIETLVVVLVVLGVIAMFVLLKRRSGLRRVRFLEEVSRALFDQGMRDAIHEFGTYMGDFKLYLYGSTELTVYKMDDLETLEEVQRLVDLAGRILKRLREA